MEQNNPRRKWSHDSWRITDDPHSLEAICAENGVVTVRQHDLNEYDEVKMSAGFIFRIAAMLKGSRQSVIVEDSTNHGKDEDYKDEDNRS